MENLQELWKPVKGFEDSLRISNTGKIKTLERTYLSGKNHSCLKTIKEKLLKGYIEKAGYHMHRLARNEKTRTIRVHRLVAEHFIPNPDNLPCVNHKDGNKLNNHVSNLEWSTYSENNHHKYEVLNYRNYNHVIPEEQIFDILRTKFWDGFYKHFSEKYGIKDSSIYQIKHGISYKKVIQKYIELHGDYEKPYKIGRKPFSSTNQPINKKKKN